jgi:hypothetical protein
MTPKETKHLSNFLKTFDTIGLGEGDLNAGVNTLAAMACTLANIARPGSGIYTKTGKLIRVGSSILSHGSLSGSLINDEVITPLLTLQNNLTDKVFRALDELEQKAAKEGHSSITLPDNARTYDCSNAMLSLFQTDIAPLGSGDDLWVRTLNSPPTPRIKDLATKPKIVVSAAGAADLKKQLVGLNHRHPLVIFGLSKSATHESTSELLTALMEGYLPGNIGGHSIKGNLIVTDPGDILRELAKAANEHTAWLGRLLWLVDGCAGPEACIDEGATNQVSIDKISVRFQHALTLGFSKRLNNHSLDPVIRKLDITQNQIRWIAFLKSEEEQLPGITGSARNLFATLVFGIIELTSATEWPKNCKYTLAGIEVFARFLVQRMANARSTMVCFVKRERDAHLKETILLKLKDGPHTVREITRRFSKLKAEPCRELLYDLEAVGKITRINDEWQIRDSREIQASSLTLET